MEQGGVYVGINVAKVRVDVAIRPGGDRREVSNDEAGIAALAVQMQELNPAALVLEASGGLELPLVAGPGGRFSAGSGSQPSPSAGLCQSHRAPRQD